jgi:hypothetical protein
VTSVPDGDGRLRPGHIPDDILAGLDPDDAAAYSAALGLVLAVHRGERPREAPPRVLQALAAVAWGEMVARRMVTGMSSDVATAQAADDAYAWMLAFSAGDS